MTTNLLLRTNNNNNKTILRVYRSLYTVIKPIQLLIKTKQNLNIKVICVQDKAQCKCEHFGELGVRQATKRQLF